ncbi:MAG TPA: SDR family NAD(P)-dependent oxidoreductase, partial [Terriglobales bacterium]|nr:SDR family NAD(P)-dependent oxidoreductase [Terriglobales bacterium]
MATENVGATKEKIAVITGGSRGLGRNIAINLAKRGVDVILTYHSNEPEARAVVTEIEGLGRKAAAHQLDTGNVRAFEGFAASVRRTLQSWKKERFDYLVNNAGKSLHAGLEQTTEEQFDGIVNVHFKGVYFLTQKLLPLMNDGGRIVNISSGLARFALPGSSVYGATKAAVETLTR